MINIVGARDHIPRAEAHGKILQERERILAASLNIEGKLPIKIMNHFVRFATLRARKMRCFCTIR